MDITKMKPLHGRTLVIDEEDKEKTSSGIYLPSSRTEDMKIGTVLETSDSITDKGVRVESEVKKGDTVLYRNVAGAGNCFEEDGNMYRVLVPAELIAVVE